MMAQLHELSFDTKHSSFLLNYKMFTLGTSLHSKASCKILQIQCHLK